MAKKYITRGRIFYENSDSKAILDGRILNSETLNNTEQYYVDEAQLREPNLWIPGKRSLGPVQIDWKHPLTKGLVHCIIPVGFNGVIHMIDIADRELKFVFQDPVDSFRAVTIDNRGNESLYAPYSSNDGDATNAFSANGTKMVGYTSASIHAKAVANTVGGGSLLFGTGGNTGYNGLALGYANVGFVGFVVTGAAYYATHKQYTYSYTGWRSLCGIWYGSNNQKIISEGVNLSVSSTIDNDPVTSIYSANNKCGILSGGAYKNDIKISHVFVYGRALKDEEAAALDIDPYQFLIPA